MANSRAPLGEVPVPKMPSQGNAKAGGGHVAPPLKGNNAQRTSRPGKQQTASIKAPGSGSRGQVGNRAGNSVPRAS